MQLWNYDMFIAKMSRDFEGFEQCYIRIPIFISTLQCSAAFFQTMCVFKDGLPVRHLHYYKMCLHNLYKQYKSLYLDFWY